jgi:hypothetical protein
VAGPDGLPVGGTAESGPQERSWQLTPRQPWAAGPHQLTVDPALEDLAGNSIVRVFDRDLTRDSDETRLPGTVIVWFCPR